LKCRKRVLINVIRGKAIEKEKDREEDTKRESQIQRNKKQVIDKDIGAK